MLGRLVEHGSPDQVDDDQGPQVLECTEVEEDGDGGTQGRDPQEHGSRLEAPFNGQD